MLNSDKLPLEVAKTFSPFLEKQVNLHGSNLLSVAIYGSSAGTNYIPNKSNINSVFVFRSLDSSTLILSAPFIASGYQKRIVAPLFLTKNYIERSLDVFPIEFLEIKENNVLVHGEDVFNDLMIKGKHLRLFSEQQLKGVFVRVTEAFLDSGKDTNGLNSLLKDSLNSLMPIFRNLLRLKGIDPKLDKDKILEQFCQEFKVEKTAFSNVFNHLRINKKLPHSQVLELFKPYYQEIQKLTEIIDQLQIN